MMRWRLPWLWLPEVLCPGRVKARAASAERALDGVMFVWEMRGQDLNL